MGDETMHDDSKTDGRVGFRDIYRAVGESETRIKEHISLVLLPITSTVADHEIRLRTIESEVPTAARTALATATELDGRVGELETWHNGITAAGIERRRIGDLSARALAAIVLVSNFLVGSTVAVVNLVLK